MMKKIKKIKNNNKNKSKESKILKLQFFKKVKDKCQQEKVKAEKKSNQKS